MNNNLSKDQIDRMDKILEMIGYEDKKEQFCNAIAQHSEGYVRPSKHLSNWEKIAKTIAKMKEDGVFFYDEELEATVEVLRFIIYAREIYLDHVHLDEDKVNKIIETYKEATGDKNINISVIKTYDKGWDPNLLMYKSDVADKALHLHMECNETYKANDKDVRKAATALYEKHKHLIDDKHLYDVISLCHQRVRFGLNEKEKVDSKDDEIAIALTIALYKNLKTKRGNAQSWEKGRIFNDKNFIEEANSTAELVYATISTGKYDFDAPYPLDMGGYYIDLVRLNIDKGKVLDTIEYILTSYKDEKEEFFANDLKYLDILMYLPMLM